MEKLNHKVSTAPGGKKFRERYFNPAEVVCLNDDIFIKVCTKDFLTVNQLAAFEEAYTLEKETNLDDDESDLEENLEEEDDEIESNELAFTLHNSSGYFSELENKEFYF